MHKVAAAASLSPLGVALPVEKETLAKQRNHRPEQQGNTDHHHDVQEPYTDGVRVRDIISLIV